MRLSDFSTLTFDCYGTLVDWESGMYAALQPLWSRASGKPSREDILKQAIGLHQSGDINGAIEAYKKYFHTNRPL